MNMTKTVDCDQCDGSGEQEFRCPECSSGIIRGCGSCGGTGIDAHDGEFDQCTDCYGTGEGDDEFPCAICDGTGNGTEECDRCNGTGKIEIDDEE